jgi:hypothetical protein
MSNKKLTGGGNDLKGIPPTATNFFGLLGRSRTSRVKAGMGPYPPQPPPSWFVSTYFSVGETDNTIFDDTNHHSTIVSSGPGTGEDGFNSMNSPYKSPAYVSFEGEGNEDLQLYVQRYFPNQTTSGSGLLHPGDRFQPSIDPSFTIIGNGDPVLGESLWRKQGRYIRSKTLDQIGNTPNSWARLKDITITWIAGSETNGGDRPDMARFSPFAANKTGLPTDGGQGNYHCRENLYVEFFGNDNLPLGKKFILWKTIRNLLLSELNPYSPGGHTDPSLPRPFSVVINDQVPVGVYKYPDPAGFPNGVGATDEKEFTTTVITAADFADSGINLGLAKFFVIRQSRHNNGGDNYGIKHVSLSFGG